MPRTPDLDPLKVDELHQKLMGAVRDHYLGGVEHRDRVFEALSGLAFTAAAIIVATGGRKNRAAAEAFFAHALVGAIDDMIRNPPPPIV